jgi:hypothetical protein
LWAALYASLERTERMHWTLLTGARAVSLGRDWLTVTCSPDALAFVNTPKTLASLKERARELGAGDVTLKFVAGEAPAAPVELTPTVAPKPRPRRETEEKPAKPQPMQLNKEEFINDPLIKDAIEVFKAQLIDVRVGAEAG